MSVNRDTSKIVSCLRPVLAEPTMSLYDQILRFDYILGEPLSVQITLDRKHRFDPKQSKPLGYFHFKFNSQLLDIGKDSLAAATVMMLREGDDKSADNVARILENVWQVIKPDVVQSILISLQEIRGRRVKDDE